jgi:hypothetical protein
VSLGQGGVEVTEDRPHSTPSLRESRRAATRGRRDRVVERGASTAEQKISGGPCTGDGAFGVFDGSLGVFDGVLAAFEV